MNAFSGAAFWWDRHCLRQARRYKGRKLDHEIWRQGRRHAAEQAARETCEQKQAGIDMRRDDMKQEKTESGEGGRKEFRRYAGPRRESQAVRPATAPTTPVRTPIVKDLKGKLRRRRFGLPWSAGARISTLFSFEATPSCAAASRLSRSSQSVRPSESTSEKRRLRERRGDSGSSSDTVCARGMSAPCETVHASQVAKRRLWPIKGVCNGGATHRQIPSQAGLGRGVRSLSRRRSRLQQGPLRRTRTGHRPPPRDLLLRPPTTR